MKKKKTKVKNREKTPPAPAVQTAPAAGAAGGHSSVQKNTVFVSMVTGFITTFMGSALNLSIPAIETEFQAGAAAVGWNITLYMLTCAALTVPFGRLADAGNREKLLRWGIFLFAAASLAAAFAGSMGVLLLFRFAQGMGASMIFSTNTAILVDAFDSGERGKVLGYSSSATYVGLSAGPVLGGVLNHHLGWRSVFLAAAAVSAAALYSACRKLPTAPGTRGFQSRPELDRKGSLLYVLSITTLMYGLSVVTTAVWGWILLAAGGILTVWFFRAERKALHPVVKTTMLRSNPVYACLNLAAMVNYGAIFAISYLLSIYLQIVMGYTSQMAGLFLITAPVVQAALSPLMGRLSDRCCPRKLSAAGMGLCTASLIFYAFLPERTAVLVLLCALTVTGTGLAMFASPNANAVMAEARPEDYGAVSSLLATMRSVGHTASMAVITAVVGVYAGSGSLSNTSPDILMATIHTSFLIFTFLCIIGIIMVMKRKP